MRHCLGDEECNGLRRIFSAHDTNLDVRNVQSNVILMKSDIFSLTEPFKIILNVKLLGGPQQCRQMGCTTIR